MRLTNNGIKPGNAESFDAWFSSMPGSKTLSDAEMQNGADAYTKSEGELVAASHDHNDMEVQYAMAVAGYQPTVTELGGLMLRSPEQFASTEVALRNTVTESATLAAVVTMRETVELNDQIAA